MSQGVEVIQVIRTTLLHLGEGTKESPIRIITQYWSMDGELLWQFDPLDEMTRAGSVLR